MSASKPPGVKDYRKWLREELGVEVSQATRTFYETVASRIVLQLQHATLWEQLCEQLPDYDSQYRVETSYPLLATPEKPKLHIKPFESVLEKSYRKNIIDNDVWPCEPEEGWVLPDNWFTRINDIIRTLIVVKYLDGVEFLGRRIEGLCRSHDLPCQLLLEAREEG